MQKLNLKKIAEILGVAAPVADIEISDISTDSRTVGTNDLFIAIAGDKFDGHEFVADVINNKFAAAAIVQRPVNGADIARQIIVPDTRRAYLQIGNYIRMQNASKVIALTGSAGKTTTKEEMKFILSVFAHVHATEKNYNNDIGVPQTLCAIPNNTEIAIIEIGMNHAGEIATIVPHVAPDIAIVTNVYPMHLENFESIEDIARAKAEIFDGLKPGGIAIINGDSICADILIAAARAKTDNIITFGKSDLESVFETDGLTKVTAKIGEKTVDFVLGMAGEHQIYNALCVLNTVNALGPGLRRDDNLEIAAGELINFGALPGRGKTHLLQLPNGGKYTLIDESYSAQPESLKIAIQNFARMNTRGRKIAVIGKMAEIGEQSAEMHTEIGRVLANAGIDVVIGVCPETRDILAQLKDGGEKYYFESNINLEKFLIGELLQNGDTVMIKGSHYGSQLYQTVESLIL